jgi:hypothetical protein
MPGMEELLGLPCSLFLGMMAPLNLVEGNHPSPHDSVLLTQKLHWMLWIRQVSIKRRNIINDNISGWLQTFLQLRDMEHVMHTSQGRCNSNRYATLPSLAKTGKGLM